MTLFQLIAALVAFNPPDAGVNPRPHCHCPPASEHEVYLQWNLGPTWAKNPPPPGETARIFLTKKDRRLQNCPHNETVWHAVLRATELTSPDRKAPVDLIEAARAAVPDSVWIETVRARALETVEAAESALRLDPEHVPAQVALAAAHERKGDHRSALRILRPIRNLDTVAGGPLLLARVASVLGEHKLAAESAHREPDLEGRLIEPVSGILLVGEARLLEGDLKLRLGQPHKALTLFLEAQTWRSSSVEATKRLRLPSPALERAMEVRLRNPRLSECDRGNLLACLGSHRPRSGDVSGGVRLLVEALFLPECFDSWTTLTQGGPEVRREIERLRNNPRLSTRKRELLEGILRGQPSRRMVEPNPIE
jgi:hypothetical protein